MLNVNTSNINEKIKNGVVYQHTYINFEIKKMETLSSPKETKARVQHYCDFCNEKISINETYLKSTHVNDGSIYDWKTHKHCEKLAQTLNMYKQCNEGVTMDNFMEFVSDKHSEILRSLLPNNGHHSNYDDIILQLRYVPFYDKLWFVIRHFNRIEKEKLLETPNIAQVTQK